MAQKATFSNMRMDSTPNWQPDRPYNDLPRLPPPIELETKAVLKQCVMARAALAELKQAARLIPDPAMLINTLPLLEARASSEIENIVTTADKLFRHMQADDRADPATKEALRYRRALLEGFNALNTRPLNTRTTESICTEIKGVEMAIRKVPGTALHNDATGEVIYTPPEGESLIRDLLANWERFLHEEEELDPLIRMAAAHYQFEAIHPFTDGNGRTGRVLNSLFLVDKVAVFLCRSSISAGTSLRIEPITMACCLVLRETMRGSPGCFTCCALLKIRRRRLGQRSTPFASLRPIQLSMSVQAAKDIQS